MAHFYVVLYNENACKTELIIIHQEAMRHGTDDLPTLTIVVYVFVGHFQLYTVFECSRSTVLY